MGGEPRKVFARTNLHAWRKFRGLTQEKLAERIGCSVALISMIERGERQYDQEFLEAAAEALDTEPAEILRINPLASDAYDTIFEQLRRIPESDIPRLSAALDALFPKGDGDVTPRPARKRKAG